MSVDGAPSTKAEPTFWAAPTVAKAGYKVFPVKDKEPTVEGSFYHATTDLSEIAAWIEEGRGDHDIAIATGVFGGPVAIDADTPEAFEQMKSKYGPPTYTTKRGGHWLFRHPRNGKVVSNKIAAGLDRKGDGGLVVVPPSKGRAWTNGIPQLASLPALPQEFWSKSKGPTPGERQIDHKIKEKAAAVIAEHVRRISPNAVTGGRHEHLVHLCGVLLTREVSLVDAEDILKEAWGAVGGDLSERLDSEISNTLATTQEAIRGESATGVPKMEEITPGLYDELADAMGWLRRVKRKSPEQEHEERRERAEEAWEECAGLAKTSNLTSVFAGTLKQSGVAGESKQIQLLYLALNSRHLDRPVSVAVKGPSSGGKSHLVERVVAGFPESAVYELTSMSEKALIYLDEDMRHRFLVIYEASGMEGDMQTYLIRSLLSEGEIKYQTAESTPKGIRPRLVKMEGPTGLLVTTTRNKMHPENETRLLSIYVTDTRIQTKAIFRALAEEDREEVSLEEWKALQTWIEGSQTGVSVPFGKVLAEMVPPLATRLRRDFGAVLRLIQSHALLHRAARDTDAKGRIIATVEDYAVVRELIADIVSEGVGGTVRETVKETVRAVAGFLKDKDDTVGIKKIAEKLELDRTTAQRRVKAAADDGYLVNEEDQRGKAARWRVGEPMPADVVVLPTKEDLEAEYERVRVCNDIRGETHPCGKEGCATQKVCNCTPLSNNSSNHNGKNENPLDTPDTCDERNDTSPENASRGRGGNRSAHPHTPTHGVENGSDALHTAHPLHTPVEPKKSGEDYVVENGKAIF